MSHIQRGRCYLDAVAGPPKIHSLASSQKIENNLSDSSSSLHDNRMAQNSDASRPLSASQREWLTRTLDAEGPRLLAYLRRVWGEQDAEDLFEETFLRAAARVETLQAAAHPGLYLLAIARNLARDRLKRSAPGVVDWAGIDERADARPDIATLAIEDEERSRLLAAVDALPAALREVLVLRLSTELKFEEIAELLAIPLGTALTRMRNAVNELREMLSPRTAPSVEGER